MGLDSKARTQIEPPESNYQQSPELPQLRDLQQYQQPTATCPTRKTADWALLPQSVPPLIWHQRIPSLSLR